MAGTWRMRRSVGARRWTPADLFRAGDPGGFWDFRPPNVFIDAAGTVPAGVGDPVGCVRDLGPNGLHLVQSATSRKPTLGATPDGRPHLVFDAVDDRLTGPTLPGARPWNVIAAHRVVQDPTVARPLLFEIGVNLNVAFYMTPWLGWGYYYDRDGSAWPPPHRDPIVVGGVCNVFPETGYPTVGVYRSDRDIIRVGATGLGGSISDGSLGVGSQSTNGAQELHALLAISRPLTDAEWDVLAVWMARRIGIRLGHLPSEATPRPSEV